MLTMDGNLVLCIGVGVGGCGDIGTWACTYSVNWYTVGIRNLHVASRVAPNISRYMFCVVRVGSVVLLGSAASSRARLAPSRRAWKDKLEGSLKERRAIAQ